MAPRLPKFDVGDEVMFRKMPTVMGVTYNGWYEVEGFVPDAMGQLFVCLKGVPMSWPVSRFAYFRTKAAPGGR